MTAPTHPPEPNAAAQPAPPSPYPTVQILQAAMAHRDSIRRSFESQRATLAEAIAAQKQAVTQAVANTRQSAGVRENQGLSAQEVALAQEIEASMAADIQDTATDTQEFRIPHGSTPTEKLIVALSLLTTPGSVAAKSAAAQRAMATQQFLDALKVLIAEEVARQTSTGHGDAENRNAVEARPETPSENPESGNSTASAESPNPA